MDKLASWRSGAAKDAIETFLAEARSVPVERRMAVFDHDGTLCCEKPNMLVTEFFLGELRAAVEANPGLAERADHRVLLQGGDIDAQAFGLRRAAQVVFGLTGGITPEEFTDRVRGFVSTHVHPDRHFGWGHLVYQPLLELVTALREREFAVFISVPLGIEVVRSISWDFYGVPPERVVGALLDYEPQATSNGHTVLVRPTELRFPARSASANLFAQTGRHPIVAAANTIGDRDLLDYALGPGDPALALYLVHDDAEREYAYGQAPDPEPPDWTVVSMRDDWATVFPPA